MGSRDPLPEYSVDRTMSDTFPNAISEEPHPVDRSNPMLNVFDADYDNQAAFGMHQQYPQSHIRPTETSVPVASTEQSDIDYLRRKDSSRHPETSGERGRPFTAARRYMDGVFANEILPYHMIDKDGEIDRHTGTLTIIREEIAASTKGMQTERKFQRSDLKLVQPVLDVLHPVFSIHSGHYLIIAEKIRLVVLCDKVLIFDPDEEDTRNFVYYMYHNIQEWKKMKEPDGSDKNGADAFEFMVLEGILWYIQKNFETELTRIQDQVSKHVNDASYDLNLNTKSLEVLRYIRIELANLQARAEDVKVVLEKLQDGNKIWKMYLTDPKKPMHNDKGKDNNENSFDEVKDLLNTYVEEIIDVEKRAKLLQERVEDTEKLVNVHLDTLRNQLLSMELRLSIFSLTCGVGGVIAGVFGMNLPIPLYNEGVGPNAFYITIAVILVLVFGMTILSWVMLNRRGLYSLY